MSRIGKQPIKNPSGVTVKADGAKVSVKGPKGELSCEVRPEVSVAVEDNEIRVTARDEERETGAFHGLTRALLQNMVEGVEKGYERKLEINGVGYEADLKGQEIVFSLGFANRLHFKIPSTVTVEAPNRTELIVRGCDKQQVGQVAASIRKLRPPEPYKGKGIKYAEEIIRRKAGKAFGSS